MTNPLLTLENIRSGAFPSDAHAVGFLLGQIERLSEEIRLMRIENDALVESVLSFRKALGARGNKETLQALRAATEPGVKLSPSEAASLVKTLARSPQRITLPPDVLADAHQDVVHQDTGAVRAGRSVKHESLDFEVIREDYQNLTGVCPLPGPPLNKSGGPLNAEGWMCQCGRFNYSYTKPCDCERGPPSRTQVSLTH